MENIDNAPYNQGGSIDPTATGSYITFNVAIFSAGDSTTITPAGNWTVRYTSGGSL